MRVTSSNWAPAEQFLYLAVAAVDRYTTER